MYWAGQQSFETFWSALSYKQRQWLVERAREARMEKSAYANTYGVEEDENIVWLNGNDKD